MLRAALYIRVSTDEQAKHGYSLQAQKEALTKYALEHNMLIVGHYVDDGHTARKKYVNRKEFMRMIDDIKQNKIDLVLFIKLDRWFRSVKDYYKIQEILDNHKVNWRTIFEEYDTTTASGRLHINIMLSIAQDESDRTSERIKFVFEDKTKRREIISGSVPVGYKIENKYLTIDQEKKYIPFEIFNYYESCHSIRKTLVHIREDIGYNVYYSTLRRILHSPIYKGQKGKDEKFCEPIISPEQFDRIQMMLNKRSFRQTKTGRIFIFSGLVTCSECGFGMAPQNTTTRTREYHYYRCERLQRSKACTNNKHLEENKLESYLLDHIAQEARNYIVKYEIKARQAKPKISTAPIKRKLTRLKELYVSDLIDIEEYKRDFDMYNRQLEEIELDPRPEKVDIEGLQRFLQSDFNAIYGTLNAEEKRIFWRSILKEIRCDKTLNIEIFFN